MPKSYKQSIKHFKKHLLSSIDPFKKIIMCNEIVLYSCKIYKLSSSHKIVNAKVLHSTHFPFTFPLHITDSKSSIYFAKTLLCHIKTTHVSASIKVRSDK